MLPCRIEAVIGEKLDGGSFGEVLKNGQALVKLVNKIKAGSVKKMETSGMAFKQMENISNFLRACRAIGVEEYEVFETVDLFEEKDLNVVVDCLYALSRTVQKKIPSFAGPYIGQSDATPPLVSVFECTQATQSLSLKSENKVVAPPATTTSSKPSTAPPPPPPKPPSSSSTTTSTITKVATASSTPVNSSGSTVATGTRGAGYGLDADIARKQVQNISL